MITNYTQNKHPDFIGDIHGHFDALEMLFKKMGYEKKNGIYSHPERFPVFVGDYIDRGPKIPESLNLVRTMQENGSALALMGNHEYNFLCFHHKNELGQAFRENSEKNLKQIIETKKALNNRDELNSFLKWMATLPLVIDSEKFRSVHAQWNQSAVDSVKLSAFTKFNEEGLIQLYKNNKLVENVELLLKGKEISLPEYLHYKDYEGHHRKESRVKWWGSNNGNKFGDHFASLPDHLVDIDISGFSSGFNDFYGQHEKPVFFGHYWLRPTNFGLAATNACCVDFSVAKEGLLAAYRFSGELRLDSNNLFHHTN